MIEIVDKNMNFNETELSKVINEITDANNNFKGKFLISWKITGSLTDAIMEKQND